MIKPNFLRETTESVTSKLEKEVLESGIVLEIINSVLVDAIERAKLGRSNSRYMHRSRGLTDVKAKIISTLLEKELKENGYKAMASTITNDGEYFNTIVTEIGW